MKATNLVVMCFLGLIEANHLLQKSHFVGMSDDILANGMDTPIPEEAYNNSVGKEIKSAVNLVEKRQQNLADPKGLPAELFGPTASPAPKKEATVVESAAKEAEVKKDVEVKKVADASASKKADAAPKTTLPAEL